MAVAPPVRQRVQWSPAGRLRAGAVSPGPPVGPGWAACSRFTARASNEGMTIRARFTPEEWTTLLRTPLMAAMVLVAASPSGPLGVARELVAAGRVLAETRRREVDNAIAEAVSAELGDRTADHPRAPEIQGMSTDQVRQHALGVLRDAVGILYRKADEAETEGFKRWLYSIAVEVAHAAREGGFLGIGGPRVSEEEAAALRQMRWALGLPVAAEGGGAAEATP